MGSSLSIFRLDRERWQRISAIADLALEMPPEQVPALLAGACGGDADLRAQVEGLLSQDRAVGAEFLDHSAVEMEALEHWLANRGDAASPDPGHGRFVPGTLLAGRYRIVALAGRGGMGEVYRADDLKLGQPVALKFLPARFEREPDLNRRLLGEVSTARRIAHPNVCRVYDVVESEHLLFVTMEFVDGEDLATLLGRVGRLAASSAADIARQFASGLAAAHELGLVHRDLKPSNVLMDGRGRIRIADFGLAVGVGQVDRDEIQAGTRAYMAPEQRRGHEVDQRSDVYALGLVLYELFAGSHPFAGRISADTPAPPPSPTEIVDDFDPGIARVILQCLEPEPSDRPASAIEVLRALPGGDLLAAAMAVGETPSPELVAAVGPRGAIRPRVAVLLLAMLGVGLAAMLALADSTLLIDRIAAPKSIAALGADAREIARRLGHDVAGFDAYSSSALEPAAAPWYAAQRTGRHRWDFLASGDAGVYSAMHRFSPRPLVALQVAGMPTRTDPARRWGDVIVVTDTQGRLRGLEAFPRPTTDPADAPPVDWSVLFELAGLDPATFQRVEAVRQPEIPTDARAAWMGTWPDASDAPVRLEAAALQGRAVFFEIDLPWSARPEEVTESSGRLDEFLLRQPWSLRSILWLAFFGSIALMGGSLLWRNLRAGTGDRRGARRLAMAVVILHTGWWIVGAHHVPKFWDEAWSAAWALKSILFAAGLMWALYIVLEPVVRGVRPDALVATMRLLRGGWLDPLVGRDLLIGLALGPLFVLLGSQLHVLLPALWGSEAPPPPFPFPGPGFFGPPTPALPDARSGVAGMFALLLTITYAVLAFSVFFFMLQRVLRSRAAALAVAIPVNAMLGWTATQSGYSGVGIALGLVWSAMVFGVLDRFGPLGLFGANLAIMVYHSYPLTLDPARPYFGIGLFAVAGLVALAGLLALIACGRFATKRRPT